MNVDCIRIVLSSGVADPSCARPGSDIEKRSKQIATIERIINDRPVVEPAEQTLPAAFLRRSHLIARKSAAGTKVRCAESRRECPARPTQARHLAIGCFKAGRGLAGKGFGGKP